MHWYCKLASEFRFLLCYVPSCLCKMGSKLRLTLTVPVKYITACCRKSNYDSGLLAGAHFNAEAQR